jgi:hypothetical protein
MNIYIRDLFAAGLVACLTGSAGAQSATDAIQALGQTPEYGSSIYRALLDYEETLPAHCKSIEFSGSAHTTVLAKPTLDASGKILNGRWKETAEGSACGEQRTYNVLVSFNEGKSSFAWMLPGNSNADHQLQSDTMLGLAGVMPSPPLCRLEVMDTGVDGEPSHPMANGKMSPWRESWTIRACETTYTVPVVYTPDPTGISIAVVKEKIAARTPAE